MRPSRLPPALGLVIDQHHPGAGPGAGQRGGQAGRAGADDQQFAMRVHRVVAGQVRFGRQPPEPVQPARDQPVDQFDRRRGAHRLGVGRLDLHERVRLLDPGGHDAARAAVLDAVGDLVHAVGEQGRGECVAG